MGKFENINTYPDTQRDNPVLKKLADIVKEHDMAGALLIVVEKDDDNEFLFLSYHRPGFRNRINALISKMDGFIGWLHRNGMKFN